jgi:electron transport complex protein RnfC
MLESIGASEMGGWIDRLNRGGLVVDRHNSPDLVGQMTQGLRRPIDTVLCSVLDVDPHACLNSALAARFPLELAAGVIVIGRLTHARRAAIIMDERAPTRWFSALRDACADRGIAVEPIINDYPQGDPTLMMYAILGRRLRPGRLPTDLGAMLFDAAAAIAIGRFALMDAPPLEVPLVVRHHVLQHSDYVTTPADRTIGQVLQELQISPSGNILRAGDLLRDMQVSTETPIDGGELLFHISSPVAAINPNPCIRCGWCIDGCPTRVQPASVLEAAQRDDVEIAEHAGIEACIECGICTYICPSNLPLLEAIRRIKRAQREMHMQQA